MSSKRVFILRGGLMMEKLYDSINRKKNFFWAITLIYIVFNGCCLFPLNNKIKTMGNSFLFVFVFAYIMIALVLTGLMRAKPIKVFLLTLFFTAIGMGLRYVLEFGEFSNTVNFTGINILVSLIAIPLFVMLAYSIITKLKFD